MIINALQWDEDEPPTEAAIRRRLQAEGLQPYRWSNGPGDVYGAHTHRYHKVIYVVSGSITFGLPSSKQRVALHPGDRLELPPGVLHDALVGPEGVVCLEAHRG
ncbi:MAG TPA: cupin domain-containing protein [Herpetosiphonaceae bacterium]